MNTAAEKTKFLGFLKFANHSEDSDYTGVYEFKNGSHSIFLSRDGVRMRLNRLMDLGEPHDETSKAFDTPEE